MYIQQSNSGMLMLENAYKAILERDFILNKKGLITTACAVILLAGGGKQ